MLPVGFEPEIPAGERAQTHTLDSATTGNACDTCLIVDMPANIQFTFFSYPSFFFFLQPQVFVCIQDFFLLAPVCRFTYL